MLYYQTSWWYAALPNLLVTCYQSFEQYTLCYCNKQPVTHHFHWHYRRICHLHVRDSCCSQLQWPPPPMYTSCNDIAWFLLHQLPLLILQISVFHATENCIWRIKKYNRNRCTATRTEIQHNWNLWSSHCHKSVALQFGNKFWFSIFVGQACKYDHHLAFSLTEERKTEHITVKECIRTHSSLGQSLIVSSLSLQKWNK
jgi:hypothetical protein